MQELTRDSEEAHQAKADAIQQYKEFEKKYKSLEADLIQLQEDLSAAERARRTAEAERDDLQEEMNANAGKGSLLSDEKRRLDARLVFEIVLWRARSASYSLSRNCPRDDRSHRWW